MSQCPPAEQLEQFLDGQLDDVKRLTISRHIDGCPACQTVLETITGPTSIASASIVLKRPAPPAQKALRPMRPMRPSSPS